MERNVDDELWTTNEVARFLAASRSTVWRLVAAGLLPRVRIGGLVRFRRSDVLRLVSGDKG